jgi:DNA repair exonuclease SbcCD ATPase subunit
MNDLVSVDQLTTEILIYKQQTAQNIIEIGKRLIKVKEQLPHGDWGKWLDEKVDFTDRTAQRFIRVAREFSNATSMSHLPQTKVFALLDLPQDQREDFVESNPVEDMTTRELKQAIKEKKEAERRAQEAEKALRAEKNKPPKVVERVVERKPLDYDSLKSKVARTDKELEQLKSQLESIRKVNDLTEKENERFRSIQEQINRLSKKKEDMLDSINTITDLSTLAIEIEHFIKEKLAPVKYSRSLERLDNEVARENLIEAIAIVENWTMEMRSLLPRENVMEAEYESID